MVTISLVFLTGGKQVALLAEDTPQGVVQRYLMAIYQGDFQKAFGYLYFDPSQKATTFEDWLGMVGVPPYNQSEWKANLGKSTQNSDHANVEIIIDTLHPGGPFGNSQYTQRIIFQLVKIQGNWLIISPTYIYWVY